jgi:hypothetical protein
VARIASVVCLLVVFVAQTASAGVLTSTWDGTTKIGSFGFVTSTFGQTFLADNDHSILNDFTFTVGDNMMGGPISFKAQVYQWQGSLLGGGVGGAIGPALFSTNSIVHTFGSGFTPVTTNTGSLALTPGLAYVMLLTVSDPVDYSQSSTVVSFAGRMSHANTNGGGGFVFYNNGNNYSALNTTNWNHHVDLGDLAFTANFAPLSVVPEPSSLAIFGLLGGIGIFARRCRCAITSRSHAWPMLKARLYTIISPRNLSL